MKTTVSFAFILGFISSGVVGFGDTVAPLRPNIILIMSDDMGWSDIGCYGGEVRTPALDRLAAEGVRFSQFYNNAKCTTTRASIVTGLYPRHGGKGVNLLDDHVVTFGEVLREAGYQTETKDLAAAHPDLTRKLASRWRAWAVMTGVKGSED